MNHPENIGDYNILEFLGSGGMSVVYHAYDTKMDREIAIKMLKTENFSEQMALRFHREAKAASHLTHQNIIRIFDFGMSENNQPYMVLEYLKGTALDTYIKENSPLDLEESIDLAIQITDGMIHAHKSHIVHRDLKPSNIILVEGLSDDKPMVKILDFGIAKVTEIEDKTLTKTGLVVGSPNYMSPEQARGEDVDERTDIYSLGCILFEMMTGIQPFRGDSYLATLTNQINNPPPALSEFSEYSIDDSLERIISMCLAKKADQRYKSMQELKEALENHIKILEETEADESSTPSYAMAEELEKKGISWIPVLAITGILAIVTFMFTRISSFAPEKVLKTESKSVPGTKKNSGYNFAENNGDGPPNLLVIPEGFNNKKLSELTKYRSTKNVQFWSLNSDFENSDLNYLHPLDLEILALVNSKVDDEGLSIIAKRNSLESLAINQSQFITDAGLKALRGIQNLQIVSVKGSKKISNQGVKNLSTIKNLICLDLRDCPKITGDCIDYLYGTELRCLLLKHNKLTKDDYKKIGKLKHLQFLSLAEMNLTDSDLDLIPSELPIIGFDLQNNKITNKGLDSLKRFTNLQYVDARDCLATDGNKLENIIKKNNTWAAVLCSGDANEQSRNITKVYSNLPEMSLYYIPELYRGYTRFFTKYGARKVLDKIDIF